MPGVTEGLTPNTAPILFLYEAMPARRTAYAQGIGACWVIGTRSFCGTLFDYLVARPGSVASEFVPARNVVFADNLVAFPAPASIIAMPPCDTETPAC